MNRRADDPSTSNPFRTPEEETCLLQLRQAVRHLQVPALRALIREARLLQAVDFALSSIQYTDEAGNLDDLEQAFRQFTTPKEGEA